MLNLVVTNLVVGLYISQKDSQQQQCVAKAKALMKFVTRSGFFRLGPSGDGTMDSVTIQTISKIRFLLFVTPLNYIHPLKRGLIQSLFPPVCFRELCGLCWMLNVRDQLSMSCRKYQAARNHGRDPQVPHKGLFPVLLGVSSSACVCDPL